MGFSHLYMRRMKGLQFYKLFGSGVGEGFTPVLNPNVYAIMAVWDSVTDADQNISNSSIFKVNNLIPSKRHNSSQVVINAASSSEPYVKPNPEKALCVLV